MKKGIRFEKQWKNLRIYTKSDLLGWGLFMKKILIISEFIAPFQAVASIRWTKIAKYLKKNHNVSISVVTINKRYKGVSPNLTYVRIDELLKKDLVYFDKYLMIPGGKRLGIYFKVKNLFHEEKTPITQSSEDRKKDERMSLHVIFRKKIREKLYKVDKKIEEYMQTIVAKRVFGFLKKRHIEEYDIIISSFGPFWTHLTAEKIKNKYPKICWLADFRDPCATDYDDKGSFKRHKEFVVKHCIRADYLLRVNDRLPLYQASSQRVVTINNGYDPDEALEALPPSKFYVVYTGTLYELDDLSEIFHAFKELIDDKLIDDKDVVFQYAGYQGDLFFKFARKFELDYLVQDFGIIERRKSLSLQQNAALLIIAGWNTKISHCEWTGKMYEYVMAKKPIIYMMSGDEPHSLPSRDMGKLGGVCYEQCRHEETYILLRNYIVEKYLEWKNTGDITIKYDENYSEQYAYPKIAEKVWKLMESKIERMTVYEK